jgi:hypothetical protein
MSYTHPEPTHRNFIPLVAINTETGADYDTLLSLLDGWTVTVHHHDNLAIEPVMGVVDHSFLGDDCIHVLGVDDSGRLLDEKAIDLELVRWIQVM